MLRVVECWLGALRCTGIASVGQSVLYIGTFVVLVEWKKRCGWFSMWKIQGVIVCRS